MKLKFEIDTHSIADIKDGIKLLNFYAGIKNDNVEVEEAPKVKAKATSKKVTKSVKAQPKSVEEASKPAGAPLPPLGGETSVGTAPKQAGAPAKEMTKEETLEDIFNLGNDL